MITFPNPLRADTLEELITAITGFVFELALILAPLLLIIAGIWFVTSAGNPNRVTQAKNIAIYTIIGFIIVLLATGLVELIEEVLKGER